MTEKFEGRAPKQETKYNKPPEGACPSGLWGWPNHESKDAGNEAIWVHDATCDCEKRTGRDAYTGEQKEE
jgi:hypothetical protein